MAAAIESLQRSLNNEIESMKKLQKRYQKLVTASQQLETQLNENQMVKEELEVCKPDAKIYKLITPALMLQTLPEAKSNVGQRIEYIEGELKRNAEQLESAKKEMTTQRQTIGGLEEQLKKKLGASPGVKGGKK